MSRTILIYRQFPNGSRYLERKIKKKTLRSANVYAQEYLGQLAKFAKRPKTYMR